MKYAKLNKQKITLSEKINKVHNLFNRLEKVIPWIILFSGGKDSLVVLDLLIKYYLKYKSSFDNEIIVVYNNTLLEYPSFREYIYGFLQSFEQWIHKNEYNLKILITTPIKGYDFISAVLLKGYPLPNWKFRWCQYYWKIAPTKKILKELGYEMLIIFTGERYEESLSRKRSLNKLIQKGSRYYPSTWKLVHPISNWSREEIIQYLVNTKSPWGFEYKKVLSLYEETERVRNGCWICTIIKRKEIDYTDKIVKQLKEISDNPEFRTRQKTKKKFKYSRLNEKGKEYIRRILEQAFHSNPDLFKGYLDDTSYKEILYKYLLKNEKI